MEFMFFALMILADVVLTKEAWYQFACAKNKKFPLQPYLQYSTISQTDCLASCANHAFCASVNYNIMTASCDLFAVSATCESLTDSVGSLYWVDGSSNQTTIYCENGGTKIGESSDCLLGWAGKLCERRPKDCSEAMEYSSLSSAQNYVTVLIHPDILSSPLETLCQFTFGGSIIAQQRSVKHKQGDEAYFNKTWEEYKTGFGTFPSKNFWLGLDSIHAITSNVNRTYLFTVLIITHEGYYKSEYKQFRVEGEANNYRVHMLPDDRPPSTNNYDGDALFPPNDPTNFTSEMAFSTWDRDNDDASRHCARDFGGGWWFSSCGLSNINGIGAYSNKVPRVDDVPSIWWGTDNVKDKEIFSTFLKIKAY